jgi:hypothetical protein
MGPSSCNSTAFGIPLNEGVSYSFTPQPRLMTLLTRVQRYWRDLSSTSSPFQLPFSSASWAAIYDYNYTGLSLNTCRMRDHVPKPAHGYSDLCFRCHVSSTLISNLIQIALVFHESEAYGAALETSHQPREGPLLLYSAH